MTSFDKWLDDLTEHVRSKEQNEKPVACSTCDDTGMVLDMVCYGGPPQEVVVYCPDCDQGLGTAGERVSDEERGWFMERMYDG